MSKKSLEKYITSCLRHLSTNQEYEKYPYSMTDASKKELNNVLLDLCENIRVSIFDLVRQNSTKTVSMETIRLGILFLFTNTEFVEEGLQTSNETVSRYNSFVLNMKESDEYRGKRISEQTKANIIVSPSFISHCIDGFGYTSIKKTKTASVYLATFIQYICENILTSTLEITQACNKKRISLEDLHHGVMENKDLYLFLSETSNRFFNSNLIHVPRKIIATTAFSGLCRHMIMSIQHKTLRISVPAMEMLQSYIEDFLATLLKKTEIMITQNGRSTITENDLTMMCKILGISCERKFFVEIGA